MATAVAFNGSNSGLQVGDNHGQITISEKVSADQACLRDLQTTNPRHDKDRIETAKGGLLKDAYNWILEHADFKRWRYEQQSQLLWIKGDPGKGKTMLLCGIINELTKSALDNHTISFFFCQGTNARLNHATAVLRGLIFMLVDKQPPLISHVRRLYDKTGKRVFEDVNAWEALSEMLTCILKDPLLKTTYLIVDALDECITDRKTLLELVAQKSSAYPHVKWIVSSRNWPAIEEALNATDQNIKLWLELELNEVSVADAVAAFIDHKVQKLTEKKNYNDEVRDAVSQHLLLNAHGTFLWVALVCEILAEAPKRHVRNKLEEFPPGLDRLYERMLDQISDSDDAKLCKSLLSVVTTVYRPITLDELGSCIDLSGEAMDDSELVETIRLCGSFLTLRGRTISLVHQSAKDFLHRRAAGEIFPDGEDFMHYTIFSNSLQAVIRTLRRDIYSLVSPGYPIDQVRQPDPDPLATIRYACIYWVDHLDSCSPIENANEDLQEGGLVSTFFHNSYLHWLEALSLSKSLSDGVALILKLESLLKAIGETSQLLNRVRDACRFLLYHKIAIESHPLQVYASGLIFSPARSLTRIQFEAQGPAWITRKPTIEEDWSACLQTLEGHSGWVNSVTFSHDSTLLASASDDGTVKVWDANTGQCLQTLEGHSDSVNSITFSHDFTLLASASGDRTVKVWDSNTGQCLQTLEGHSDWVNSVAFSHDSTLLASASDDGTVKVWDANTGQCLQTLEGHSDWVNSVTFSYNSTLLASASDDGTVKIWIANTGQCLETLKGHSGPVRSVTFSHDSTLLASASDDSIVKVWIANTGQCLETLKGHSRPVSSVTFSHDSEFLASASNDSTVKVWDSNTGQCLQTLKGHSGWVNSVTFSHDSTLLASASNDRTVKVWDANTGQCLRTPFDGHDDEISLVAFSHDSKLLASSSRDKTIKVWDTDSGQCLKTLKGDIRIVYDSITFSHDSKRLAIASEYTFSSHCFIKVWDVNSGICLQTLEGHSDMIDSVTFYHDSQLLSYASAISSVDHHIIEIWDIRSGQCLWTFEGHSDKIQSVKFSHDSKLIASASRDGTIKLWQIDSGQCLQTLEDHGDGLSSVTFSHDSKRLASASTGRDIKVWDTNSGQCLQTLEDHGDGLSSVTFSHDSKRLASSKNKIIRVWDTGSGQRLETIYMNHFVQVKSFDITNSYLNTDIGTICLSSSPEEGPTKTDRKALRFRGYSITSDFFMDHLEYGESAVVTTGVPPKNFYGVTIDNMSWLSYGTGAISYL